VPLSAVRRSPHAHPARAAQESGKFPRPYGVLTLGCPFRQELRPRRFHEVRGQEFVGHEPRDRDAYPLVPVGLLVGVAVRVSLLPPAMILASRPLDAVAQPVFAQVRGAGPEGVEDVVFGIRAVIGP
jgi:hypothetical protein